MYYILSVFTIISAFTSLGFSMQSCIQTKQVNAFYAFSRSLAIALLAFITILITNNSLLISLSILMIIVQLLDGVVGIISKNRFKTYGRLSFHSFIVVY